MSKIKQFLTGLFSTKEVQLIKLRMDINRLELTIIENNNRNTDVYKNILLQMVENGKHTNDLLGVLDNILKRQDVIYNLLSSKQNEDKTNN